MHACSLITCVVQILQGPLIAEVMLSGNTRENISGAGLWCSKRCNRRQDPSVQCAHTLLALTFSHSPLLRGTQPSQLMCVSDNLNLLFFSFGREIKYFLGNKSINTSSAGQTEHVTRLSKIREKKIAKAPGLHSL